MSINGWGGNINAYPKASLSMCTHFPTVSYISERIVLLKLDNIHKDINSMRAAVEQRCCLFLRNIDMRRRAKDKVELLPQHPGSEIAIRRKQADSIPRKEVTYLHHHQQ